jgi:phosphate-selective porin OprO/OprP
MRLLLPVLLATCAIAPAPADAQPVDLASVHRQIADLQAEIVRLKAQVDDLSQPQSNPAPPSIAPASGTSDVSAKPAAATDPGPKVTWKGAPELRAEGGWSFKPRGRLQLDTGWIDAPSSLDAGDSLGFATEVRRAYLGLGGTLPGGLGYRLEADFASDSVELTDAFLTYEAAEGLTLLLGHHKPFFGLEEETSDLLLPFMERAAFNTAFGFERRIGLSGTYETGDWLVQGGVFTANASDLSSDGNNSYSLDGRVVFSPELAGGRLHLGGSAHFRDLNDASDTVRYRARPFIHTTDLRLVDTLAFSASGERHFGAELAYMRGPFHATLEGHRMTALRPGLANPSLWGGYAEIGMLLTAGDTVAYSGGAFDRVRPVRPVNEGGIGALQLNARYDRLDLNDGAIRGGRQEVLGASLIWIPTDYVRFLVNYGHLWIADAAIPAGMDTGYQADTVAMRAQFDF